MLQCSLSNLKRVYLTRSQIQNLLKAVQTLQRKLQLRKTETDILLSSLRTCYVRLRYSNRAPGVHGHFSAYCLFTIRDIKQTTHGAQPFLLIGPEGSGAKASISECSNQPLEEKDVEILNWVLEIGSQNGSASRAGTKNMFKPLQLQHMQYAAKRKMTIVNIIKATEGDKVPDQRKVNSWCNMLQGKSTMKDFKIFGPYLEGKAKEAAKQLDMREFPEDG
mmetsp:Transcript_48275/g.92317  ORF Transcript_48275/g.92317 Transcript_48275/m.92317 type:complete len:220 (-) Transcript_48275:287-946(-)